MSNMYENAKTWNPFKGCRFDCSYCRPSFQAQAKRQRKNCEKCYNYAPHMHWDRITKIPKADIVFACGNGDVAFATRDQLMNIIHEMQFRKDQTFYLQSKAPACFATVQKIPDNVILVTTLETNIDTDYGFYVSESAPRPTARYRHFAELDHPRKVVTIEPIMEFDETTFAEMIRALNPEYVWIGYNSRPKQVHLPEPSMKKTLELIADLEACDIKVKRKDMNRDNTPDDEMPKTQCPKCGEWVEDFDGFGVWAHDKCGYCSHPSRDGGKCTICGDQNEATK